MIEFSDAQIDHVESMFDEFGEETQDTTTFVECERCLIRYPADDDYWYFLEGELRQPCRECTRKAADEKHEQNLIAAAKTATAVLSEATINKIVKGEVIQVSGLEHLTDSVLSVFAGEAGIAKLLMEEYHSAKPNAQRVRILELITKMVGKTDEIRMSKEKTHEIVTDDDLLAILQRLAPKLEHTPSG